MSDSAPLLEAKGIEKAFPGVKALQGVDLTLRPGTLHALLGENGAGKSTLMNILAGVFPPDSGEIRLAGKPVRFRNPREAQEAGIAIIFQELVQLPDLTVAENIFLGREPTNALGLVDYEKMNREARELLRQLELEVEPDCLSGRLRVGEQQVVEIAKALSFDARVLIMDEPTSALSEQEIEVLFRLIAGLKQRGVGIIYITHKLDELSRIADDITIFRDGKFVAQHRFQEITRQEMIRLMVGREWASVGRPLADAASGPAFASPDNVGACGGSTGADDILRVSGLSLPHPRRARDFLVQDVSFLLRRGEVLGIFGLMGAGRTELLEAIFGCHAGSASGTVEVAGRRVSDRSPRAAIEAGLGLAPEDRKADGLVLPMSVAENVTLAGLGQLFRSGLVHPASERSLAQTFVDRLQIKTPSTRQIVRNLSGGNQQKVVLAKWLVTKPKVLLLDEPTRGIDVNAKREIYALIDELARGGLGVVMVSSELPEILAVADRILVLCEGRLTGEFSRAEATEEKIMHAALPVTHAA